MRCRPAALRMSQLLAFGVLLLPKLTCVSCCPWLAHSPIHHRVRLEVEYRVHSRQMLCVGGSAIPLGWSFLSIAKVRRTALLAVPTPGITSFGHLESLAAEGFCACHWATVSLWHGQWGALHKVNSAMQVPMSWNPGDTWAVEVRCCGREAHCYLLLHVLSDLCGAPLRARCCRPQVALYATRPATRTTPSHPVAG